MALTPREAFLRACTLDVAVRKPGNVCLHAAGHGMHAAQFLVSASVAADAICQRGATVGQRIEAAVVATRAAVGCNTNLGILLLCAPLACAAENIHVPLQQALQQVLAGLTIDDAAAAFRAIAHANPGGLGEAPEQDVRQAPSVTLLQAMALAAERDRIAAQYRDGFAEVFASARGLPAGFRLPATAGENVLADATTTAAVQVLYLRWLGTGFDSHIVRKQGKTVAQNVMSAAQGWQHRSASAVPLDSDPAFAAWDQALKEAGVNPGTSADLTVVTLMAAGLLPG
jgi:triphosphoribosyl-dephospho-CoA synthase